MTQIPVKVAPPTKRKTAVDAPRGTFFWLDPDDVVIIGVDTTDGPEHRLYDQRAFRVVPPERVNNYRHYGVRKPIAIEVDGDRKIVIDGRGRVLGARAVKALQIAAGEKETIRIPAIVVKGDESHLYGLSRALNLHDSDDAITNAKNAQRMLDMGRPLEEVAVTFGVSDQTIRNWQAMLSLAPEVVEAIQRKEVSPTAATALAALPRSEQATTLAEVQREAKESGGKVTVERVASKARERTGKPAGNTPKAKLDKIGAILTKLSGVTAPTKEDLLTAIDKVCRLATGHTLEKLGDIGD